MDPPMYRMVLPMPLMEWGQKASPLGQCHQLKEKIPAVAPKRLPLEGKLSAKQTEEVSPLHLVRLFR